MVLQVAEKSGAVVDDCSIYDGFWEDNGSVILVFQLKTELDWPSMIRRPARVGWFHHGVAICETFCSSDQSLFYLIMTFKQNTLHQQK